MGALLSPNALLISTADWSIPAKRDAFLDHIWGYLEVIDKLDSTSVFWSDELTAALFTNPKPPWFSDASWRIPIVQALFPTIEKHWVVVSSAATECSCTTSPTGACTSCSPEVDLAFLKLIHELGVRSETTVLLASRADAPDGTDSVRFACIRHAVDMLQVLYRNRSEYSRSLKLSTLCWPAQPDNGNYERLKVGVQLVAETELTWPTGKALPAFRSSRRFLDDLARQTAYRHKILKTLALRLTVGLAGATTHPTLQDEDPHFTDRGRKGERRFRATEELRFHYLPLENDSMFLVRFFGPGEHDDGLR